MSSWDMYVTMKPSLMQAHHQTSLTQAYHHENIINAGTLPSWLSQSFKDGPAKKDNAASRPAVRSACCPKMSQTCLHSRFTVLAFFNFQVFKSSKHSVRFAYILHFLNVIHMSCSNHKTLPILGLYKPTICHITGNFITFFLNFSNLRLLLCFWRKLDSAPSSFSTSTQKF